MDEQRKSDHWDFLVSSLGATPEPPPPAENAEQDEPASTEEILSGPDAFRPIEEVIAAAAEASEEDVFSTLPQASFVPAPPARQKTPNDWARLASELGLEITLEPEPEPEPPAPQPAEVAEVADTVDFTPEERPAIVVTTLESSEELAEEESDATLDEAEEGDEERRGRRRRRRRRRPRSPADDLAADELEDRRETPTGFGAGIDLDDALLDVPEFAEEAVEAPGEDEAEEEEAPARSRRRRRRKKRSREAVDADEARPETDAVDDEMELAASPMDDEDEGADDGEREPAVHRAIPTWDEAVGLLITANIEARARNPERRPPHRPRGRGRD